MRTNAPANLREEAGKEQKRRLERSKRGGWKGAKEMSGQSITHRARLVKKLRKLFSAILRTLCADKLGGIFTAT